MNRNQRTVALVFLCAAAVVLFLSAGPFAEYHYAPRAQPTLSALLEAADVDKSTLPSAYVPRYPWNPLAGTMPTFLENPIVGIVAPLLLVGLGLVGFFGRSQGGSSA